MALFLSTYVNKLDKKGRVSVPASFRAALATDSFQGVVLFSSHTHPCLEGFSYGEMEKIAARLDHFDLFSSEQDDMATALLGEAVQLSMDGDGRVIVPSALCSYAGFDGEVAFVGLGRKFQLWSPERYELRRAEAREQMRSRGLTVPGASRLKAEGGGVVVEQNPPHISVMLPQVLEALRPSEGELYVDGTFGAGGYSRAILNEADCRVIALDRDKSAAERAAALTLEYGERFALYYSCFSDVADVLAAQNISAVDALVLDIGVSSMQLDEAERGFSFRYDAPLDMRMDRDSGKSAADYIRELEEEALADIIYKYGEERHSRRIARRIVAARKEEPILTTGRLAQIVREAVPSAYGRDTIDPATRTFQAIRILVNDELGELERVLEASLDILKPEGRLVVVSFHSLEDAIVKRFLRQKSGMTSNASRYLPQQDSDPAYFTLASKKAIFPSDAEIASNPRSRSARLRCAVRTNLPYKHNKASSSEYGEGCG